MKFKVAEEVAEQEFDRMCAAARIDTDTSEMNEKDLAVWTAQRRSIVKDIRRGTLIVGDDGMPTYTPPGGAKGFTFHLPTGATLIAAKSRENDIEGTCLALADMTREDRGTFSKLDRFDLYACARLAGLFLADQE